LTNFADLYQPHEIQLAMHQSGAQQKALEWARRLGKSRSALFEGIDAWEEAKKTPASSSLVPPFLWWIVAPTDPQSEQAWDELLAFIPKEWHMSGSPRLKEKEIIMSGNANRPWGRIAVKSAWHEESLQTAGLDFLWVTEAQDISNEAFQRLRPMLISPERLSRAVWEGIPALYPEHWWWKLADYAKSGRDENYYYSTGTAFQNPFLTEDQLQAIETDRQLYPLAVWERMYLAKRSESAGFFHKIDACTRGDMLSMPLPGNAYVAGLDLGRKADPTVLWIADAQLRQAVYHLTFDVATSWADQKAAVIDSCKDWHLRELWVDSTGMGGDMYCEELEEADLPVIRYNIHTNNAATSGPYRGSRDELLYGLAVSMERETFHYPQQESLLRQLRAFQMVSRSGGRPRPDHPAGEHDDEVFALGLALLACDPESIQRGTTPQTSGRMRYIQTQAEANGGAPRSEGARLSRDRIRRRREERWQRQGMSFP
jgi:hypothetical protein